MHLSCHLCRVQEIGHDVLFCSLKFYTSDQCLQHPRGNGWMCLNDEWNRCRFGVIAALNHVWHMLGFLRCHFNLARVRTHVFAIKFRLANEALVIGERHDCSAISDNFLRGTPLAAWCRSAYVFRYTIAEVRQLRLGAVLLWGYAYCSHDMSQGVALLFY